LEMILSGTVCTYTTFDSPNRTLLKVNQKLFLLHAERGPLHVESIYTNTIELLF
jgi:hypothetical protein